MSDLRLADPNARLAGNDFVQLNDFECCLRSWTLRANLTYEITLHAGTAGSLLDAWHIDICESEKNCIRLTLPRTAPEYCVSAAGIEKAPGL